MKPLTLVPSPAPAAPSPVAVPAALPVIPSIGGGADMGVKLLGSLPGGDRNGLDVLHGDLVRHSEESHFVIGVIDCARTTIDHGDDGDVYTPIAKLLYIEPIRDPEHVAVLEEIFGAARAERTGNGTITFDLSSAGIAAQAGDEE